MGRPQIAVLVFEVYLSWSIAEAREKLSEVVRAAARDPQVITNRGPPVAVVIDASECEAFKDWREQRSEQTMAEALDALQAACTAEDYALQAPPRIDRANPLAD